MQRRPSVTKLTPFQNKSSRVCRDADAISQHTEDIIQEAHTNTVLNGEKFEAFSLTSWTRQGCLLSSLPFNIVLEVLVEATEEGNKMKRNRRVISQVSLFVYDVQRFFQCKTILKGKYMIFFKK